MPNVAAYTRRQHEDNNPLFLSALMGGRFNADYHSEMRYEENFDLPVIRLT
jgi:hypothetical protein